jgi:hypothetical protein
MPQSRNIQSGATVAESTFDTDPQVASAAERDGTHYEPDEGQIVKVVHQVRPETIPPDTETDYDERGGPQRESTTDIRVTPAAASVHEARPKDA